MEAADCAGALFYSMMRLAHNTPHGSPSKLFSLSPFPLLTPCETIFVANSQMFETSHSLAFWIVCQNLSKNLHITMQCFGVSFISLNYLYITTLLNPFEVHYLSPVPLFFFFLTSMFGLFFPLPYAMRAFFYMQ